VVEGGRILFWISGGTAGKRTVRYVYSNEVLECELAGCAIKRHYSGGLKLVAFLPHSLPANSKYREEEKDLRELIDSQIDIIYTPSIGNLHGYTFEGSYPYIKFWIFLNLLKYYLEGGYRTFYCDISQGLNVYADALKEAFRHLVVFDRLMHFREGSIESYMVYTDPIIGGEVERAKIYDDVPIRVNAWFDSPVKNTKDEHLLSHGLNREHIRLLKSFYRTYKALKYNTPPVILTFGYDPEEKVQRAISSLLDRYLKEYDPGYFDPEKKTYEYNLPEKPDEKIAIFLALSLYCDISRTLERAGIRPERESREFTLEDLEKFFYIYEHYGLYVNRDLLNKDLNRFAGIRAQSQWNQLGHFVNQSFRPRKPEQLRNDSDVKRNFFAHSGMENNCVYVRKGEDGRLIFKYGEEFNSLINEFVYDEASP
jgi:CRISPR-associated protein Csx1